MTNYLLKRTNHDPNAGYITDHLPDWKLVNNVAEIVGNEGWVVRWGNRQRIPEGRKVINYVSAMDETLNKGLFRAKVFNNTGLAPRTWLSVDAFMRDPAPWPEDGVIVRPQFHERSEHIFHVKNDGELRTAISRCGGDYYISEYIKKTNEYRCFVANGRLLIMVEKIVRNKNDITWGCVEQGRFEYIRWTKWLPHVAKCAIKAVTQSRLHIAAIDVMVKDGKAYFLEANTAPEIMPYYGEIVADAIKWMVKNTKRDVDGRKNILVRDFSDWTKYIHPCLSEHAEV